MTRPIYELSNLSKTYNSRFKLEIEHLKINAGECFVLVGPSGSGKSTLLRLLNFLEQPTSGTIKFEGKSYTAAEMPNIGIRRRITTVFQNPLLMRMSVLDNVRFGLRLRGSDGTPEKAQAALELVGLGALAHEPVRTLSGGEAQRVALARAIVFSPDVLLLDEPTANLDPYNVGLIEQIVQTLNKDNGTTIIMVTHNVFQAHRLGKRAAFLLDGRIIEVADGSNFFEKPKDKRTGAFVRGEMVY